MHAPILTAIVGGLSGGVIFGVLTDSIRRLRKRVEATEEES